MTEGLVLKAMVVEYNAVVRRQLEAQLHELGFAVAATDDPFRALGWLARHRPHVIFLDYAIPALQGADFASRAAATTGGADIPIVATGTRQVVEAPLGSVAWLSKPFVASDLDDVLRIALSSSPDFASAPWDKPEDEVPDPEPEEGPLQPGSVSSTGSMQAVQGAVLTWFTAEGRLTLPIEAVTEAGLRVLSGDELELGTRINAQIDFVELRRGSHRSRQVKLLLHVDSVSEATDGYHCGLRVEMARPPHIWKRFCAQGMY